MVGPWNVVAVFSECRRHGWGGVGGGGGVREVDDPSCQGVWGEPQENFLIQDVCRSDSNAF